MKFQKKKFLRGGSGGGLGQGGGWVRGGVGLGGGGSGWM